MFQHDLIIFSFLKTAMNDQQMKLEQLKHDFDQALLPLSCCTGLWLVHSTEIDPQELHYYRAPKFT